MHKTHGGFAAVVLVVTKDGKVPIVRDPRKTEPLWKLPGGTREEEETPEECMQRELFEETGVDLRRLSPLRREILLREVRTSTSPHEFFVFLVELQEDSRDIALSEHGNEGEEIRWSSPREILYMRDFLDGHRSPIRAQLLSLWYGFSAESERPEDV